jgi:hypothetical protein
LYLFGGKRKIMNTSLRFEQAIKKLYTAFHNERLNPEDCAACAVGNILDRKDFWKHLSDDHGSLELNYVGRFHELRGKKFNGYTPSELMKIEYTFLEACGYELPYRYNHKRPKDPTDKDVLFNGLCAVVEELCRLDGIENVLEYQCLFKTDAKVESQLEEVF